MLYHAQLTLQGCTAKGRENGWGDGESLQQKVWFILRHIEFQVLMYEFQGICAIQKRGLMGNVGLKISDFY